MAYRQIPYFLVLSCFTVLAQAQDLKLVDHLDEAAMVYGYSLVYSASFIPDTTISYKIDESASAKTTFSELTEPFGLTYNILANQVILTAVRKKQLNFSGFVEDAISGERLVGANVYIQNSTRGTQTNGYGYFSLTKLNLKDTVTIKYLGYPAKRVSARLALSGRTTIRLTPSYQLGLVEVFPIDEEMSGLPSPNRTIPLALLQTTEYTRGRPDLNAWLILQPGITSGPLGFRGLSIRGADPDQNLVLLDDATLYLPSHAAGYTSIVPGGAIKSVQLFKNAGTARYGDRVAGVLDIRMKDGSSNKRQSNIDFGLEDISLTSEGPIGKGSYFISGRRGLTDFWLQALRPTIRPQDSEIPDIDYTLFDVAGKINYPLGERERIYASFFLGKDQYVGEGRALTSEGGGINDFTNRSSRSWSNLVSSVRYNRTIGSRWFANTTVTVSQFNYDAADFFLEIRGLDQPDQTFTSSRDINGTRLRDIGLKQDAEFAWKEGLSLKIGADAIQHHFEIGTLNEDTRGSEVPLTEDGIDYPELITYDLSTYGYIDWQVNPRLDLNLGLRVSGQFGGEDENDVDQTFMAVLPRLSFEYKHSHRLQFHGNAGLSRQYIHQVSTLNPGLSRDLWVPSVNGLTPQANGYVSLGLSAATIKTQALSIEIYANQLDGLSRFANEVAGRNIRDWGQTIIRGRGHSYGAEFKYTGNISTFQFDVSYAYAVANRTFEDGFGGEAQERFKFDRRHFATFVGRYPLSENWGVGATWRIGSGLPAGLPSANPFSSPPPAVLPLTNPWTYGTPSETLRQFHSLDIGFKFTKSVKTNIYNVSFGVQNVYLRRNNLFINLREIENPDDGSPTVGLTYVNTFPFLPFLRYGITF
jgi:hypothetical protein